MTQNNVLKGAQGLSAKSLILLAQGFAQRFAQGCSWVAFKSLILLAQRCSRVLTTVCISINTYRARPFDGAARPFLKLGGTLLSLRGWPAFLDAPSRRTDAVITRAIIVQLGFLIPSRKSIGTPKESSKGGGCGDFQNEGTSRTDAVGFFSHPQNYSFEKQDT
jgi:hypothetical protein